MKLSTSYVARLLGHRDTSTFRGFERGDRLPSLVNTLRLSIIFRVPIEFLFTELYASLKEKIRAEEEKLARPVQQPLF